ncbi:MAG: choice-of-anchor tandem repeat GloVer-containing protein [Rhizomicrobium sp.]
MSRIVDRFGICCLICGSALALFVSPGAQAKGFAVLYSFAGGSDGIWPEADLIRDENGNLYGTTDYGGGQGCNNSNECGTVFKLAPDGTETVLHAFTGGRDGSDPFASLIMDKNGNLYSTTNSGGRDNVGTVFKLAPDGTETVLHAFTGGEFNFDGGYPYAGLIEDRDGNFYGTTGFDGAFSGGTVFRLAPGGKEKVLHAFGNGSDGWEPYARLVRDKSGNLYGTTSYGGGTGCFGTGCGTVFKLAPDGTETVLYAFTGGSDGNGPYAGLIEDKNGNLYGTTVQGGGTGCNDGGCGIIFKLAPDGTETVLHAFTGGADGLYPFAGLIEDKNGNLYGTASAGGGDGNGTVFKLAPDGTETVLHAFTGGSGGAGPYAGLIKDANGNLYGTTYAGGAYGYGTVFRVKK